MTPFFASTRPSRGFTLLELMLVVAILGILAAVTLPVFRSYALRAQAAEIVLVHGKHQLAFEELMAETGLKLGTDIRINTSQLKQVVEYTVKKPGATSQPVSGINYAELVLDREGVVLAYYSADYNATGPGQYKMNINVNPLITDPARKAQVMQLIMAAHYELKPYTYLNKITSDGVSLYFQIQ